VRRRDASETAGKMPALVRLRAHLVGGVKVLSKST
jgi:hypothetical protein